MRKRFHGLKRPKVRQSWNKYNLYNLTQVVSPPTITRTYFQQKWSAKSLTRAYHGETVRERHWKGMFRPTIRSVVSMDYAYLARSDGAEQALGRGSGLDLAPGSNEKRVPRTPYMNMVYAPLERRLDTAIFRALFASSTRQARQFVVHGDVKVNGKKMIYPGYQLNPGDMFQVEPERVLFATGAQKAKNERRAGRRYKNMVKLASESEDTSETAEPSPTPTDSPEPPLPADSKIELKSLLNQARNILSTNSALAAKKKQDLRAFKHLLKRTLSRSTTSTILTESLDAQLKELTSRLSLDSQAPPATESSSVAPTPAEPGSAETSSPLENLVAPSPAPVRRSRTLQREEEAAIRAAIAEARENPIDPSKPYATPWRPREWMSAFAFIPRYLEVHHKICSAVYLRHPVARPGLGEVPTPYSTEVNGLAFNWYLRRR